MNLIRISHRSLAHLLMPRFPGLDLTLFRMIRGLLALPASRKGHLRRLNFDTVDPFANLLVGQHQARHQVQDDERRLLRISQRRGGAGVVLFFRKGLLIQKNDPLRLGREEETADPMEVPRVGRDFFQDE